MKVKNGVAELTKDGAIATLRFSNPDQGLMDPAMESALLAAVLDIEEDVDIRVCILCGDGSGVFIRHYDVAELDRRAEKMAAKAMTFSAERPIPEAPIHEAMRRMEASDTIYIAALNGSAMGGGFELALACDLRVVEDGDFAFGLPEVNLGLLPGAGGTQRLPQVVGLGRALEMTLLGDTLSATQLTAFGLAIAKVADAVVEANVLARKIAAKPSRAVRHIKRLVREAGAVSADDARFGRERALFCDLMMDDEARRLVREAAEGRRLITDAPDEQR